MVVIAPMSPIDLAAQQIADQQNANITYAQLLVAGFTWEAIRHRVRSGRLFRVYPKVYSVGRPPRSPLEWATAAVPACGPGAGLSHHAALCAWGLQRPWHPPPFDVTVPRDVRIKGIGPTTSSISSRGDIRWTLGTHVTSPALALLDSAKTLDVKARARAVNDARNKSLIHLDTLAETLDRFPHHAGRRLLLPFVERGSGPTDSGFEDDLLPFCVRYDLPIPETNVYVAGHRVDALFRVEKVIIECDGWIFHRSREVFESDRDRDADTLEAGHVTVRLTKRRLRGQPDREAERLHNILSARREGR